MAPPELAAAVECFWTLSAQDRVAGWRVLPDGCADIVFTPGERGAEGLQIVGTMTQHQVFDLPGGSQVLGVRFRPGAYAHVFLVPPPEIVDATVALEDVWGAAGRRLHERLHEARTTAGRIGTLAAALPVAAAGGCFENAVRAMVRRQGCVDLDAVARIIGSSARHFRRLCYQRTGLSPKTLCRVMRFRRVLTAIVRGGTMDWAQTALECGYYDQAHLINEFRRFSGRTPAEYAADRAAAGNDVRFFQSFDPTIS